MTSKERNAALKALPKERRVFIWKVNLAYVLLAAAFLVFLVVGAIANSMRAICIGDLIYGLCLVAQAIYWPEASWILGRSTSREWLFAGVFFLFGITGLLSHG